MNFEIGISSLPTRLKRLREAMKVSQMEFARMSGQTQAQISSYELGRTMPNLESAQKVAAALGISLQDLIGEKEPATAPPRPASKVEMALWVIEAIGIDGFKLDRVRTVLLDRPYKL